jgi:hypothetical protein
MNLFGNQLYDELADRIKALNPPPSLEVSMYQLEIVEAFKPLDKPDRGITCNTCHSYINAIKIHWVQIDDELNVTRCYRTVPLSNGAIVREEIRSLVFGLRMPTVYRLEALYEKYPERYNETNDWHDRDNSILCPLCDGSLISGLTKEELIDFLTEIFGTKSRLIRNIHGMEYTEAEWSKLSEAEKNAFELLRTFMSLSQWIAFMSGGYNAQFKRDDHTLLINNRGYVWFTYKDKTHFGRLETDKLPLGDMIYTIVERFYYNITTLKARWFCGNLSIGVYRN